MIESLEAKKMQLARTDRMIHQQENQRTVLFAHIAELDRELGLMRAYKARYESEIETAEQERLAEVHRRNFTHGVVTGLYNE